MKAIEEENQIGFNKINNTKNIYQGLTSSFG
jgi:hypothetical protein